MLFTVIYFYCDYEKMQIVVLRQTQSRVFITFHVMKICGCADISDL